MIYTFNFTIQLQKRKILVCVTLTHCYGPWDTLVAMKHNHGCFYQKSVGKDHQCIMRISTKSLYLILSACVSSSISSASSTCHVTCNERPMTGKGRHDGSLAQVEKET